MRWYDMHECMSKIPSWRDCLSVCADFIQVTTFFGLTVAGIVAVLFMLVAWFSDVPPIWVAVATLTSGLSTLLVLNKSARRGIPEDESEHQELRRRAEANRAILAGALSNETRKARGPPGSEPTNAALALQAARYSEAEAAKRLEIFDQIYTILNGSCTRALAMGSQLSSAWQTEIENNGAQQFAERLRVFQTSASDSLREISAVLERCGYFKDIDNLIRDRWGFQGQLWESVNEMIWAANQLPQGARGAQVRLADTRAEKLEKGVNAFAKWIQETKELISSEIQKLSSH